MDPLTQGIIGGAWLTAPAAWLIQTFLGTPEASRDIGRAEFFLSQVEEAGRVLLSCRPPWMRVREDEPGLLTPWLLEEYAAGGGTAEAWSDISAEGLFGAFALLAAGLESQGPNPRSCILIRRSRVPVVQRLRWLLVARFEDVRANRVEAAMVRCGFTSEQRAFAWAWIRKDMDLVDKGDAGE